MISHFILRLAYCRWALRGWAASALCVGACKPCFFAAACLDDHANAHMLTVPDCLQNPRSADLRSWYLGQEAALFKARFRDLAPAEQVDFFKAQVSTRAAWGGRGGAGRGQQRRWRGVWELRRWQGNMHGATQSRGPSLEERQPNLANA